MSTFSSSMMPDRQDITQTIKFMSGPNYRTDRTHPFRGVLVSGAVLMIDRYMKLYLVPVRMNHALGGAARQLVRLTIAGENVPF